VLGSISGSGVLFLPLDGSMGIVASWLCEIGGGVLPIVHVRSEVDTGCWLVSDGVA